MSQEIKLPPLPKPVQAVCVMVSAVGSTHKTPAERYYTEAQLQAYGQACADAAVEQDRAGAPPDGSWRQAIDEALIVCALDCTSSHDDPKASLAKLIKWHVQVALDPAVSSAAQALIEADRAQRGEPVAWMTDEEPPRVASVYTKTDMPRASAGSFCIPLYTAPQPSQPDRKPMPDNEMNDLAFQCGIQREDARDPGVEEFARAIEAFHGIKP